jgi:hypothetical protein
LRYGCREQDIRDTEGRRRRGEDGVNTAEGKPPYGTDVTNKILEILKEGAEEAKTA